MIGKDLTGPIGLIVKFSTLQEYGVDKVFVLENGNTDSSQRNIVYLVHGEKAIHVQAVAGMCILNFAYPFYTEKDMARISIYFMIEPPPSFRVDSCKPLAVSSYYFSMPCE